MKRNVDVLAFNASAVESIRLVSDERVLASFITVSLLSQTAGM